MCTSPMAIDMTRCKEARDLLSRFVVLLLAVLLPWRSGAPARSVRQLCWLGVIGPSISAMAGAPRFIPLPNPSLDMQGFIDGVGLRTEYVAEEVQRNYVKACAALERCRADPPLMPCLRLSCGYQENENFTWECIRGSSFNISTCTPEGATRQDERNCDRPGWWTTYNDAFLRLPNVDHLQYYTGVKETILDHACIQSPIRSALKSSFDEGTFGRSAGLHFGSITGSFIQFPGRNQFIRSDSDQEFPYNCENYHVRERPWFAEASSPKKKVSILVDLANDMGMEHNVIGKVDRTKRLAVVDNTLHALARTLRASDRVALTTSPDIGLDVNDCMCVVQENVPGGKPGACCYNLSTSLDKMEPNKDTEDFTEGISRALSKLENMTSGDSSDVEVLLVFTRGYVQVETAARVIQEYNNRAGKNLAVFLYGVDIETPAHFDKLNLTQLAWAVNGTARNMGTGDPLLGIYSYFDYLSRFHSRAGEPFWVREYENYSELGRVISQVKPVYDNSSGHFLGVAAMNILVPDDTRFEENLNKAINNKTVTPDLWTPPSPREVLNLQNCSVDTWPCEDGLPQFFNCSFDDSLSDKNIICARTTEHPDPFKCCGQCPSSKNPSSRLLLFIAIFVPVLVALMILAGFLIGCRRCQHCGSRNSGTRKEQVNGVTQMIIDKSIIDKY